MRAFSSTLLAELRKEVFSVFWLIEIPFSQAYPTRYVDIDIDIYHDGNRYFSYPFKVGDITYTSDMAIDSVSIEVANADLGMSALLLGSDIAGVEATISFGCLDSNYQVLGVKDIFYGEISGWKILRDKSVELSIVNEFMLWRKKTLRIAQASCPWPFTDTECAYAGIETWCDQTYARCAYLTNQDNFGGFRFLPYIMEKEIWWGGPKPTDSKASGW